MQSFSDFVVTVRPVFEPSPFKTFVTAPERVGEASAVAPCAWRLAYGEVDRTEELTAARTSLRGSPPSLAKELERKLIGAPIATYVALVEAVHHATVLGYVAMIELEAASGGHELVDRSTEDIWDFWSPRFRDKLEDRAIERKWAVQVRTIGASTLRHDLKPLGFSPRFGGSMLNQLGMMYAQAGAWLRMAQTDAIDDELFVAGVRDTRAAADRRCPFDSYPSEGTDHLVALVNV